MSYLITTPIDHLGPAVNTLEGDVEFCRGSRATIVDEEDLTALLAFAKPMILAATFQRLGMAILMFTRGGPIETPHPYELLASVTPEQMQHLSAILTGEQLALLGDLMDAEQGRRERTPDLERSRELFERAMTLMPALINRFATRDLAPWEGGTR